MWRNEYSGRTPKWLRALEKNLQWIAVPNIAILFVTLQGLGYLLVSMNPAWMYRLALFPDAVRAGEVWRLITFLAMPLSLNLIFVIFVLWFLYFILNTIEAEWGAFKTTLYVLISIVVMIAFSLIFDYPVTNVSDFESSLFLAAAALFPEMEVYLFLVIPVKIKWLAWLTGAYVVWELITASLLGKFFLIAVYSSYLIFFGPAVIQRVRQYVRRKRFQGKFRG